VVLMVYRVRPVRWLLMVVIGGYAGAGLVSVGLMGIGITPTDPRGWCVAAVGVLLLFGVLAVLAQTVRWWARGVRRFFR